MAIDKERSEKAGREAFDGIFKRGNTRDENENKRDAASFYNKWPHIRSRRH